MPDQRDDRRPKERDYGQGRVRNTADDILTNPETDDLPMEDTHENLPDDTG